LKILQVVDNLGVGGAETWLVALQRYWREHCGPHVDFLMCSGESSVFDDTVRQNGAKTYYLQFQRRRLTAFAQGFRRILDQEQYDVIHDHQGYASGWHFLLGLGSLPRVRVAHIHNPWIDIEFYYGVTVSRRLAAKVGERLLCQFATHVCGTSAEVLERYGFKLGRSSRLLVSVAHCGFDVTGFSGSRSPDRESVLREFSWPHDTKIALFVGRLDRALQFDHPQNHKNSWFALNVARLALDRLPSIRLIMAGAGDEQRKQLEDRVKQWGVGGKLRLVGVRADVPRLMRAADILLFPSRQEGLGMVAVEAQTVGLPVLASATVPAECIVIPELYHALSLDEPLEKWADELIEILGEARLSISYCRDAVECSPFSIKNSAKRLEDIYCAAPR
jgi:glycosyltransferase EpsF